MWLGADVTGIVDWFVEHRLPDGGWNCEWVEGSTRSSFHSTLNSLKGLLAYEARHRRDGCDAGRPSGRRGVSAAAGLFRRLSTGEPVGPWVDQFAYPFRWSYSVLNAAEYFREASTLDGTTPDPRMAEAIELIRARTAARRHVAAGRPAARAGLVRGRRAGGRAVEVADSRHTRLEWWDARARRISVRRIALARRPLPEITHRLGIGHRDLASPGSARAAVRAEPRPAARGCSPARESSNSSRGGPVFDGFAVPHDEHVVAHPLDDREIVPDEQVGQIQFALQIREQVEHARLDRDIQRRSRFVEDQQVGFGGQRAGDAHPLTLSAGQLVRVARGERRWQSDEFEQFRHPLLARPLALRKPVHPQRLIDRRCPPGCGG